MRLRSSLAPFLAVTLAACTCKPQKRLDEGMVPPATGSTAEISDGTEGPLKNVYFAFDSYALTPTAKEILKRNADWLRANPSAKVQIEGHCDERGTNEYNMVLGQNRANASFEYLRSLGIPTTRMSTVSYGENTPADPSSSESAWAKNRRDVFTVSGAN